MKSTEFAYWLQGFFELSETNSLSERQTEIIKNHINRFKTPFIIYCDFESLLIPCEGLETLNFMPIENNSYQKHIPCSFSFYVKSFDDNIYNKEPILYRGINSIQTFISVLINTKDEIHKCIVDNEKKMIYSYKDSQHFKFSDKCHICKKYFDSNDKKVRDHDHWTGKYLGPAHNQCNLRRNYKKNYKIPVVFHNSKGYDSHFIIQEVSNIILADKSKIKAEDIKKIRV